MPRDVVIVEWNWSGWDRFLAEAPHRLLDSSRRGLVKAGGIWVRTAKGGIVHVITGRLKRSLKPKVEGLTLSMIGEHYGPYEAARGGEHDFPERSYTLARPEMEKAVAKTIEEALR